jgi:dihydrofolate reductase
MASLFSTISISLDGYVAGPEPTLDEPLGRRGEQLHEWGVAAAAWREAHGRQGGEENADNEVIRETQGAQGATIMGRRMFSGGAGPWADDPNPTGWWGEDPPFRHPVFVLTHHERESLTLGETTFTFVTDGIESALEQARAAAGSKAVHVSGGAEAIRQYLSAGLLDELQVSVAPVLLGGGTRLFDDLGRNPPPIEIDRVVAGPRATHIRYRISRER